MADRNHQQSHPLAKYSFRSTQPQKFPQFPPPPSNQESKKYDHIQENYHLKNQGSPETSPQKIQQPKRKKNQDSGYLTKVFQKNVSKPHGLPNVGNSCCVNSVIQFLYACSKIRQTLIEKACQIAKNYEEPEKQLRQYNDRDREKRRQKSFIEIVGTLFKCLKDDTYGNYSIKQEQLLHELIDKLNRLNLGFRKYQQYDVLGICNILLEQIDQELLEQQYLRRLFQFSTKEQCKCQRPPLKIDHMYYVQRQLQCQQCKFSFRKTIQGNPQFLIILDIQDPKTIYQFNFKKYILKSRIAYSGNGNYGHYTCIREHGEIKFEFNDSSVYQYKEKSNFSLQSQFRSWNPYSPPNRMCLYELLGNVDVDNDSKLSVSQDQIEDKQSEEIPKRYQEADISQGLIIAAVMIATGLYFISKLLKR